jgi:Protein of unknown function (DUF3435)
MFHEWDDNLAFCPILHVLGLAFTDDAFASEWINCPEDLQTFRVPSHLQSLPLHWKESMLEIPVFRCAVSKGGQVITSPTKALQYATIANQNLRLGKSTGFKDPFRFYCLRKGAANAINSQYTLYFFVLF